MPVPGQVEIAVKVLAHGRGLPLPRPQSAGAAGADLVAALAEGADVTLPPGGRALIPCGIAIALPVGYEGQVRPRSGLAVKHGVTVLNSPGTVDADYRGELKVALINLGQGDFIVRRGERIAQLVVAPVSAIVFSERDDLDATERGSGGFGSTGR